MTCSHFHTSISLSPTAPKMLNLHCLFFMTSSYFTFTGLVKHFLFCDAFRTHPTPPHFVLQESKSKQISSIKHKEQQQLEWFSPEPSGPGFCFSSQKNTCTQRHTVSTCAHIQQLHIFFPAPGRVPEYKARFGNLRAGSWSCPLRFDISAGCSLGSCATSRWCRGEQAPAPCDSFPHTTSQSAKPICNLLQLVFL